MTGAEEGHCLLPQVASLPHKPGVYRYLDEAGQVLYVGKAKDLRKRVASYFSGQPATPKTRVLLAQAHGLEITVTATETEALLLEANLIKRYRPRYNVLLKDDKSYPYLHLTGGHHPRLSLYRGDRSEPGRYFGPYPSATAVRETLKWLQRLFPVRQCADSQFASRQRPCLQYQIRRCGGPCRGKVTDDEYARWVRELTLFLEGKDHQLVEGLRRAMWEAAQGRAFEEAARLRDRVRAIEQIREQRKLNLSSGGDLDVACLVVEGGVAAVQVFFVRGGLNLGNRGFFPAQTEELTPPEILEAFLVQFYADKLPPPELLVDPLPVEEGWLAAALGERRGSAVRLHRPQRGEKRQLLELARSNAHEALRRRLGEEESHRRLLEGLGELLELPEAPERIEAYDVSHLQDALPVGSLVVYGPQGFRKGEYRRYALDDPRWKDDTARMGAMLTRRFRRLQQSEAGGAGQAEFPAARAAGEEQGLTEWPDLVLLDGGQGQLAAALRVAEELQLGELPWCAIAKGEERRIGQERLFLPGRQAPLILSPNSPLLYLLQNIRDEAHRFALGYHRQRRERGQTQSALDQIAGIGPKRKRALLRAFGSVAAIRAAAPPQLAEVEGISLPMAELILHHLKG